MQNNRGFTLIELMITVVVLAILVATAVALYTPQLRQGRRADGINSLLSISMAEERYRSTNTTYGTLAQVWGGVTASTGGYYTLGISNVSATSYTLTATATGDQANDTEGSTSCASLQLLMSNGTVTRSPSICWPQ